MKHLFWSLALVLTLGCTNSTEVVEVVKGNNGKDGTSCTVAPEYAPLVELFEESNNLLTLIGARISCTDGTWAIVLNGSQGVQGIQGPQGEQGIAGPQGEAGGSCQAYRSYLFSGVWLSCPNQFPVLIHDGQDGTDGSSCTVTQLSNGAKIKCGHSTAYVYNGLNGASCTVVRENSYDRAKITCGSNVVYVYDGSDGQDENGSVSVQTFSPTTSCMTIGSNASAKRDGTSTNIKLYSGTECAGTAFNMGDGDSAMTSANELIIKVQDAATLKLVTFN